MLQKMKPSQFKINYQFKQMIERFNRTYKHHVKPAAGFNCDDGAMALTTLFVTYRSVFPFSELDHQLTGLN